MTVYFVSDMHLGGLNDALPRVCRFVDRIPSPSTLYFLGDTFDFAIGHAILTDQKLESFWTSIQQATARGVRCIFLMGNHDPDLGPWVERSGAERSTSGVILCDQIRVWIGHGDVEVTASTYKRTLCALTHRPWVLKMARAIPFKLMMLWLKGYQRCRRFNSAPIQLSSRINQFFNDRLFDAADVVILGHFHHPFYGIQHVNQRERRLLVLGDWRCYGNCVRYCQGKFEFLEEKSPDSWIARSPCEL